jgi:trehalose utilization protein
MAEPIRVTVWNENLHGKKHEAVRAIYPEGIHGVIAGYLNGEEGIEARTATLDEPEQGLGEAVLAETDVLIWWGHMAHGAVSDEVVDRVQERVLAGMGLILLHSSQGSKVFGRLLGTDGRVFWREVGEKERVWVVDPAHPIAAGLSEYFEIPQTEMYGEPFGIPRPDELVFISWFAGGEVFRSGCCWRRGCGRIFYFRPGHETYPIYHQAEVRGVLARAVRWAAPGRPHRSTYGKREPLEKI